MDEKDSRSGMRPKVSALACFLPGTGGWFFLWFVTMFVFFAPTSILYDGAVARHINTGVDIIQSGQIPKTNYVWAVDPQAPWLTHELLGDLAIGGSYLLFGLNGVCLLGFLVVGLALMWSYQIAREEGLGRISGWIFFVPMLLSQSLHWLTRSHIFSYLFFLIAYFISFAKEIPFLPRLILSALTMMLWCNFHGSIFVGLYVFALPALIQFLGSAWNGTLKSDQSRILQLLAIPFAAALALAVNVRGFGQYSYLVGYLSHPEIVGKGNEWCSIDFSMGIGIWAFLILFAGVVKAWILSPRRPELGRFSLCIALFFAGVYVMRLIPYFSLIALPCIAASYFALRRWLIEIPNQSALQRLAAKIASIDENKELPKNTLVKQAALKSLLMIIVCIAFLTSPKFKVTDFPKEKMPVEAVAYMQAHNIRGLGFTLDNWGPYLYFKFHTPIFVDEKTDFYPVKFMNEYHDAYAGRDPSILDKYKIDYVLIEPKAGLKDFLDKSEDWSQAYKDGICILYVRKKPS